MKQILLVLISILICAQVQAEAEATAEADSAEQQTGISYVRLSKGMVINYGEPSLNRLKYLKVAVDVRVKNANAADLVEYHSPALMDALIEVFSASEVEVVKTSSGKEEIRQKALKALQAVMTSEEGDEVIQDLLFSSFVVQR